MIFIQIAVLSAWRERRVFGSILQRSAVEASKECPRSAVHISRSIHPFSGNG